MGDTPTPGMTWFFPGVAFLPNAEVTTWLPFILFFGLSMVALFRGHSRRAVAPLLVQILLLFIIRDAFNLRQMRWEARNNGIEATLILLLVWFGGIICWLWVGAMALTNAPAPRQTSNGDRIVAGVASSAVLEVLDGPLAGSRLTLPPGRSTLGRDAGNRIVLLDARASSHHAAIVYESGQCWLEDLSSSNGTFVDERRVTASCALAGGERIRMGGTSFLFRRESPRT